MFNLLQGLLGTSVSVVELVGKAVEVVGEVTDSDTLKQVAEFITDNADNIAK